MIQLPKGYYAVQPLPADATELVADSFTYKGVEYAVTVGTNLFATIAEALAAATEPRRKKRSARTSSFSHRS